MLSLNLHGSGLRYQHVGKRRGEALQAQDELQEDVRGEEALAQRGGDGAEGHGRTHGLHVQERVPFAGHA